MQAYNAFGLGPRMLTAKEFYAEITAPTSRFASPLSYAERLRLRVERFFVERSTLSQVPIYIESITPLNWQLILNYLYREGVLENAAPGIEWFRHDKPKIPKINLKSHHNPSITTAPDRVLWGSGSGLTFDESISKAIGELLERYFNIVYTKDPLISASTNDLIRRGKRFLHPEQCSQFSSWQKERFSKFRFTEHSRFHWIQACELGSNATVYVPAQLMYWQFDQRIKQEPRLASMNSNGMAGGFTRAEATVSAIKEYVERDGFLAYWMNTLSPPVIDVSTSEDKEIQELLRYLKRFNITPYFLNTTTDIGVPSMTCVLIYDQDGEGFLSTGAATGHTAKETIFSSYKEAVGAQSRWNKDKELVEEFPFETYEPFVRTDIGLEARVRFWHGKEMLQKAKFFTSGPPMSFAEYDALFPTYASAEDELNALITRLHSKGHTVYVCEKQSPILRRLGYHVVATYIPTLLKLHAGEHEAPLGMQRLQEVAKNLGYQNPVLNIYPHPFP